MMQADRRKRAVVSYVAAAVLLGAALVLSFELGRYRAGYARMDARRETTSLEEQIAERDAVIEDLRRQQAILETSREIDRETYDQVEADLDQLQAKMQAQEEELAFYRGIVSPGDIARETGADLIAIGTHGRSGIGRMVMGSVANAVMRRATLPCLLVHPSGK